MPDVITPVADGFAWLSTPAGLALSCLALAPLAPHVFTTRDLAFRGAGDADYARLGEVFGLAADAVVRVRQVHGDAILDVRPGLQIGNVPDADAIISTDADRAIAVRTADCVPILLGDRRRRVVAAVHAGWRGTAAGVASVVIRRLVELGIPAADLVAAVGPSIGPCCYQVDDVVRDSFGAGHGASPSWFKEDGPGRWKLDLWRAAVEQLIAAGMRPEAVHLACVCTADHPERFYSFRRRRDEGRMVAAVRLPRTDA
jgi:YfiH family protein